MEVEETSLYRCLTEDMKRLSYEYLRLVSVVVYEFLRCDEEEEKNS